MTAESPAALLEGYFMEILYRWLIGDMGQQGDHAYQPIHLYSVAVVAAVVLLVTALSITKKLTPHKKRTLLAGICWFQLGFEVLWRLIYWLVKGSSLLCWWPIYPCNLGGILIPIIALCNWKTGKKMFYLFGFVGGVLTFALPNGIYSSDVMVFPSIKSILQHTGLLLIPLIELGSGTFRPSIRHMGWVIAGLLVHLANCEGIDRLLGFEGDYMFFRSGMPFVIPGVPQYITLSVFALLVLCLLSLLCDWTSRRKAKALS